jgi:hypothetical protein
MGGCCARDPRIYGCGMKTQLSRYAEVGGLFALWGITLTGTCPKALLGGLWFPSFGSFERRRGGGSGGAARSLNVNGREGTGG